MNVNIHINIKQSFYIHSKIRFKPNPNTRVCGENFCCEIWTKTFKKSNIEEWIQRYHWAWVKKKFMVWIYFPKSYFNLEANLNIRSLSDKFIYAERKYVHLYIQSDSVSPEITYRLFNKKIFFHVLPI